MRVRECMLHLPLSDLQGMTPAVLCELLQAMGRTDVPPSVVRLSAPKRERLMAREVTLGHAETPPTGVGGVM